MSTLTPAGSVVEALMMYGGKDGTTSTKMDIHLSAHVTRILKLSEAMPAKLTPSISTRTWRTNQRLIEGNGRIVVPRDLTAIAR